MPEKVTVYGKRLKEGRRKFRRKEGGFTDRLPGRHFGSVRHGFKWCDNHAYSRLMQ